MDKIYGVTVLILVIFMNFVTYQTIMIQVNYMKKRLNDIEFELIKGENKNDIQK